MSERAENLAVTPAAAQGHGDGTVGKALDVLDQVSAYGRPVRFGDLLRDSAFPKATLYRLLQTLTSQEMLRYDAENGTYGLGIRLMRLAHAAWHTTSLAPLARPHIDALSAEVGETVHLAQLDHAQVLYVDKRIAGVPVQMYSQAGKVGPAYCTGVGKAMLAFLPADELDGILRQQSFHRFTDTTLTDIAALTAELEAIRDRGHAYDREEHEPGIICIAVPVLSAGGRVLGGLSATATTARRSLADLDRLAPSLHGTARRIAEEAALWRFSDHGTPPNFRTG